MYTDRGIGTRKREIDRDKDRNWERVTGRDVQGQGDMEMVEGDE